METSVIRIKLAPTADPYRVAVWSGGSIICTIHLDDLPQDNGKSF